MYSTETFFSHFVPTKNIFTVAMQSYFSTFCLSYFFFQFVSEKATPRTLSCFQYPSLLYFLFFFLSSVSHKPHSSLVTLMQLSSVLESCTCFVPGVSYTPLAYTMISSPYSKALQSNTSCSYSSCLDSISMIVFRVSNHV